MPQNLELCPNWEQYPDIMICYQKDPDFSPRSKILSMKNKEQILGCNIYSYLILTNIDQMITTHVSPGHDK